jgi:hypothetical protein
VAERNSEPSAIQRLIGVYNANGTLTGELAYFIGARLGRKHCSLCDITHGSIRPKPEWETRRSDLAVPFDTYHLNDQPDDVRLATGNVAPAVLAQTSEGVILLLGPESLSECHGIVDKMMVAIEEAVIQAGLSWPPVSVA